MARNKLGYHGYCITQLTADCGPGYPVGAWIAYTPGDYAPEFSAPTEAALKASIDAYQPALDPWELPAAHSQLAAAVDDLAAHLERMQDWAQKAA